MANWFQDVCESRVCRQTRNWFISQLLDNASEGMVFRYGQVQKHHLEEARTRAVTRKLSAAPWICARKCFQQCAVTSDRFAFGQISSFV